VDLLLDTHVFVWWDGGVSRLGEQATDLISAADNRVFVSAASIWEIAIKRAGRIVFEGKLAEAVRANGFDALPCDVEDCELAGVLEWTHADPFDRMIVAQAQRRGLTLITADRIIMAWPSVAMIPAQS
jgi:PIN domain nuclease of toxin-antitoxin system